MDNANDARLASACVDPSSASCVALSMEAKAARDDQITLGIGVEVLGANANGKSDLIIGKVLSAQNLAASRQWCEANPKECITQLQGLGTFATGVLKGIPNAIPGTLNIPSTVLDGYINMYQAATGGTLTQLPKLPSFTDCAPGLQSGGCVAGEIAGGVVIGSVASAALERAAAAKAAKAARTLDEGTAANGGSGTKLPIATDGTATSPYSSSGTTYGKTTLTDANGNPIPTQPSLPGAGATGATSDINSASLGDFLGKGGNKNVYAYGDGQAVAVLQPGKLPQSIADEIGMLNQLKDLGIPTVNARSVTVNGQPAMIMDQFAQGSKDIVALQNGKVRIVGDSPLLNAQSVSDLQNIRNTMVSNNVRINDLQFLIGKDGRVVVADPLKVNINTPPSDNNLRMIDLLIQAAKKNGPF